MADSSPWSIDQPVAQLCAGAWQAKVDVSRPQLGLHDVRWDGARLDGQLLCITPSGEDTWPAQVADAYVRSQDLVAAYKPAANWPFAPHIYWRSEPADGGVLAALSLLVSIQTSLLDTHPRVDVCSSLAADEVLRVAIGAGNDTYIESLRDGTRTVDPRADVCCVLRRLPGGKLSCAEFMPASDFQRFTVDQGSGTCATCWELFSEFLEKGVIRRARLQLALVDRQNDVDLAAACGRAFLQRPLPLTV